MVKLAKPKQYFATVDFELDVTTTSEEFKDQNGNGFPDCKILERKYRVTEECQAIIGLSSVSFKPNQRIKDVGQAMKLLKQEAPIEIKDRLLIPKGYLIQKEELAQQLLDENFPLEAKDKSLKSKPSEEGPKE